MKAAEKSFPIKLHGSVDRPIAIAMMNFGRRKILGLAVDGSRRSVDYSLYFGRYRGFEDVKGPRRQNVVSEPRIFRTLGDSDGSFVKDGINTFHHLADELGVANITFNADEFAGSGDGLEILPTPSAEIVQHDNLLITFGSQSIGNMGSDQSGTPCN
jgi:hypothetical protein